jgi:hypothetical protein
MENKLCEICNHNYPITNQYGNLGCYYYNNYQESCNEIDKICYNCLMNDIIEQNNFCLSTATNRLNKFFQDQYMRLHREIVEKKNDTKILNLKNEISSLNETLKKLKNNYDKYDCIMHYLKTYVSDIPTSTD